MLELVKLCLIAMVIVIAWQPFFRLFLLWFILLLKTPLLKSETQLGRENVPKKGPGLVLTNHFTTGEEAGLLFYLLSRIQGLMQVYLLYKKELDGTNLKTMPFGLIARIFLRGAGFRPTHREQRDEVASDWTAKRLTRGKSILAMPEGTSRHEGLILAKRKGLARLAMQGNYWVLPVAIPNGAHAISDGLSTWRSRFKTDKRHNIVVVYGKPFFLKDLGLNLHNDPTGEKATTEIMVRIGAMLPEHLRGFYASAVKEFLSGNASDVGYYRNLQTSLDHLG